MTNKPGNQPSYEMLKILTDMHYDQQQLATTRRLRASYDNDAKFLVKQINKRKAELYALGWKGPD